MAIGNFGLPFNLHTAQKVDLRAQPSKYALSALRPFDFTQSAGDIPSEYFAPYKYLPVCFMDTNTEDWVVIPKGRIVAGLSAEDSTMGAYIAYPVSSGSIYVAHEATELGGAAISKTIDGSYYGYEDGIVGALALANGGVICTGFYSTDDVTAGTIKAGGAVVASGATAFNMVANAPIGVAFHDWYQDIRGMYLNYKQHPDGGHVLCDWYVQIPYIKVSNTAGYSGINPQYTNNSYSNLTTWRDINKKYTYLTVDKVNSDVFKTGVFVQPDYLGNYKIQGGASSMSQSKNVQTVGRVIAIDARYPKSGLEDVITYPGSGMPGTQTAGIPKYLFDFVYECIKIGFGTAPTVEEVYNAVRSGEFGMVRIQLLIS